MSAFYTQPHRQPQHMLPAQYTIERETARLSLTDRLSLYHGTHPTAGTGTATARLSLYHGTHPPSARVAALCYVCAYTYPQEHPTASLSGYRWRENEKSNKKRILLLLLLLFCYYAYFYRCLNCYISVFYSD